MMILVHFDEATIHNDTLDAIFFDNIHCNITFSVF